MVTVMVAFHKANEGGLIHDVETIFDVKFQIQRTYQINAGDLILEYKDKLLLEDDERLASLPGFGYDTCWITVYIKKEFLKEVKLRLLCSGEDIADRRLCPQVPCGLTVRGLKQEINRKLGVSPYRMRLSFKEDVMTDDNLLRDYILSETPTFFLQIAKKKLSNFFVKVSLCKDTEIVAVDKEDTIYTLAFLYREKLKLDPEYKYELSWKGKHLLGPKTLEEYDIPNLAVLEVAGVTICNDEDY